MTVAHRCCRMRPAGLHRSDHADVPASAVVMCGRHSRTLLTGQAARAASLIVSELFRSSVVYDRQIGCVVTDPLHWDVHSTVSPRIAQ